MGASRPAEVLTWHFVEFASMLTQRWTDFWKSCNTWLGLCYVSSTYMFSQDFHGKRFAKSGLFICYVFSHVEMLSTVCLSRLLTVNWASELFTELDVTSAEGMLSSACPCCKNALLLGQFWFTAKWPLFSYCLLVCLSVCLSVCLFVCAECFSAVFDLISIKLGHMLYVWF